MTMTDPFASLPPAQLSPAGAARRDALRAELTGLVRSRRRLRRTARAAAAALFVAIVGWFATRSDPPELPPPSRYTVIGEDRTVIERLTAPERPLAAEVFLDDDGLQDWLRRAGLPPGYVRTPERIMLMPEVLAAVGE